MRAFRIVFATPEMVNHVILIGYTIFSYHESPKMSPLKGDFASLNQMVRSAWTDTIVIRV